mgnify:CR=1 FL=1
MIKGKYITTDSPGLNKLEKTPSVNFTNTSGALLVLLWNLPWSFTSNSYIIYMYIVLHFHSGILSKRWRLLYTRMVPQPEKAVGHVWAMCAVQLFGVDCGSMLRATRIVWCTRSWWSNLRVFLQEIQVATLGVNGHSSRSSTARTATVRCQLAEFFSREAGSVSRQLDHVRATQ